MAGLPVDTYRTLGSGHKIAFAGEQLAPNPEYESTETFVTSPLRLDSQEIKEVIDDALGVFFTDAWWLGGTLPTDTPTEYAVFYSDHSEQAIGLGTDPSDSWFNSQALSEPLLPNIPIVAGIAFVDLQWWTASLPTSIPDPVVIVGPPSRYGPHPGVIRIRNVSQLGFEMRFQEWTYLDDIHYWPERVFYLLAEPGERWEQDLQLFLEAGTAETDALARLGDWQKISFGYTPPYPCDDMCGVAPNFPENPAVFAAVQTYNDSEPVTTRQYGDGSRPQIGTVCARPRDCSVS
jgi:hypothetical protein